MIPITFAICVSIAVERKEALQKLFDQVGKMNNTTFIIWSGKRDKVNISKLRQLRHCTKNVEKPIEIKLCMSFLVMLYFFYSVTYCLLLFSMCDFTRFEMSFLHITHPQSNEKPQLKLNNL